MTGKTTVQIQRFLDVNLHRFDLPQQYLGTEPNAYGKDWDSSAVRWCLVASWPYEAAAGNQSIPAVYKAINKGRSDFLADRFYLPATPRDLKLLEKFNIPIFGIESKHQLLDFDAVGTSIAYPVLSLSYVKMLAMSGIPVRWREREKHGLERYPMVVAGGQSYAAPEVLSPVVDCWFCGEAEDEPGNPGIAAVTARIAMFKALNWWSTDRLGCYEKLAREFNFLYFPRFVTTHYGYEDRSHVNVSPHESKQVIGFSSNLVGMRLPFKKRHVKNLDNIDVLDDSPLLFADPAMGSGDIEVARGCPAFCSFCALSWRNKPYRQMTVPKALEYAKGVQQNMGSVRLSPFSPDFPMYTQKKKLIAEILENVSDEVDAPAMRVDDFVADKQFVLLQVHGGMDSVTLGVEGGSQRMRDLVGKGTSDDDIKEAVTRGIRAGLRKFKLFMISNLPGEDEGDLFRVLKLARDLADIIESMNRSTVTIQFSWTPLMIEANTPFQWFAPTVSSRLMGDIWEELRDLKIEFKVGSKGELNKAAFFQLCQRASADVGEALVDVMVEIDQACWGGVPRTFKDLLDEKLKDRGFHNGLFDCFDERDKNDMFGWEFIDTGVSTELLWVTYQQMREFLFRTDSHTYDLNFDSAYHGNEWVARCDDRCMGKTCGACDRSDLKIRTGYITAAQRERDVDISAIKLVDQRSQAVRIRAQLFKPEAYRFVGNDHWRFALRRAAFRAQARLASEYGIAKRSIRFASDGIKHRDWTSGIDYVEFALTRRITSAEIQQFVDLMNLELEGRLHIRDWVFRPITAPSMRTDVDLALFEMAVEDEPTKVFARLQQWQKQEYVPMRLRIEAGYFAPASEEVNAKDYVEDLWLVRQAATPTLRMLIRGRPSPYNVYAALMGQPSWIELARLPAVRLDAFVELDRLQQDFLRPGCVMCGLLVPINILDQPYHPQLCPHCLDNEEGIEINFNRQEILQ